MESSTMNEKTAKQLEDEVTKMSLHLDLTSVSDEDTDHGMELINDVHAFLERTAYDRRSQCVVVLGATGVGKSAVVSLLFGEGRLLVHHENEYTRALVAENPLPGVNIQSGSLSKTLLPGVLRATIDGKPVVVFDMPGTQDTRGPFAELVVHIIMTWLFKKYECVHFILVATPPQERSQFLKLAALINKTCTGGLNAVLVYTKCDSDFNPQGTREMKDIDPDKRNIPAFALPRPKISDEDGKDYSSAYQKLKNDVLNNLVAPLQQPNTFVGSIPKSVQLLLQKFFQRSKKLPVKRSQKYSSACITHSSTGILLISSPSC